MSDQKCPECGQEVGATSKTAVLNRILAWDPDPWYKFLSSKPGTVWNVPLLGQVMTVASQNPDTWGIDDGYGLQGTEPECWVVLSIDGRLYRKNGKTDSYCNEFNWNGPFVEVVPEVKETTTWKR